MRVRSWQHANIFCQKYLYLIESSWYKRVSIQCSPYAILVMLFLYICFIYASVIPNRHLQCQRNYLIIVRPNSAITSISRGFRVSWYCKWRHICIQCILKSGNCRMYCRLSSKLIHTNHELKLVYINQLDLLCMPRNCQSPNGHIMHVISEYFNTCSLQVSFDPWRWLSTYHYLNCLFLKSLQMPNQS